MDKLRSTLKQFVRDWSEQVGYLFHVKLKLMLTDRQLLGKARTGPMLQAHDRRPSRALFRCSARREVCG